MSFNYIEVSDNLAISTFLLKLFLRIILVSFLLLIKLRSHFECRACLCRPNLLEISSATYFSILFFANYYSSIGLLILDLVILMFLLVL